MALVDMDTVQFYQPAKAVGQRKNGQPATSSLRVPMACGSGNTPPFVGPDSEWSGILQNCDLIEIVDMTGPPPNEPFNLFQGLARDPDSTKKDAEGTVFRGCF